MSEKKLSLQSSIAWNSIGSIFYLGCQWLMTVVVVWIAGLETAGILSLAMSVSNIWYSFAVYGMRNFQVSDTVGKYKNGTYVVSRYLTGIGAFAGCLIYTFVVGYDPYQKVCILLYFVYKLSEALFDVYAGIFQKNWRLDYVGKSLIIRGFLSIFSFILLLLTTNNIAITFGMMALLCMISVFTYDISRVGKLDNIAVSIEIQAVFPLLKECFPLVVYTLLSSAIGTIPRLFMERILGNYQLGIYGSVATPTLIIQMGATYVFNPFVTLFAEKYYNKEKDRFLSVLGKCTIAVGAIAVLGILGGKLLGYWGLKLLYGNEVASHSELLIPLIMCTILTAFSWLLCGVLTAIREFKGLVIGNMAAVMISALLSFPLEKFMGMQGASLTLALATVAEIFILGLFLWKNIEKQFK